MYVGAVIIGDELLSGKRKDKHLDFLVHALHRRGMELVWVRMVGDHEQRLIQTFEQTLATPEIVFSFGGIGSTPDDLTRPCLAKAAKLELVEHPQAKELLEHRFGDKLYPHRIRMAQLPAGASLIPNPVNRVPGFSILRHHCVPGFPNMARPMVDWVLDTHYLSHHHPPPVEILITLKGVPESDLIPLMESVLQTFPKLRLSSLPSSEKHMELELGIRGEAKEVEQAVDIITTALSSESMDFVLQRFKL